ncbi:oligopeptide transporter 4-like [Gossypium australe]|uniref:Oligopeptide transporter 4-like n=1 Tax=Gossypium australe TaxID=47621 RepID=A0A5B6WVS5_9ROSI|nr:oligopeptide transporter 4-like [Gossypium australe]
MQNPPPTIGNIPCKNPLFDKANHIPPGLPPPQPQLLANMVRNERTLNEYAQLNLDMVQGSIMKPTITTNNFEIKPAMIQMIQNNLHDDKGFNQHLKWFLQICNTLKYNRIRRHQDPLRHGTSSQEYSYKSKTVQLRRENATFKKLKGESFHEDWEHFKMLIQKCPYHGLPEWLDAHAQLGLDGAVG